MTGADRDNIPRSVDKQQAEHFESLATEWWEPQRGFRQMNRDSSHRQDYICHVAGVAGLCSPGYPAERPLTGLRVADVGCGGGFVSEPLTRLGAAVVGIDIAPANIAAARKHALHEGLDIDYRVGAVEDLARSGETFDLVVALEVVEHVADVKTFLTACSGLVGPAGVLVISTINRTLRSALTVIYVAEFVLRWIPKGTHYYSMFVKPREVDEVVGLSGLELISHTGCKFHLLSRKWGFVRSESGNYLRTYRRV